jgi:hypothetical protein
MPELSRFYGIVIKMHFNDHLPPHFHAEYGEDELAVGISPITEVAGKLPRRAAGLVMEWAALHQSELADAWRRAQANLPLPKIDPLP